VEAAEYGEILLQLNALATAKTPGNQHSAQLRAVEADSTGLQNTLAYLQTQLADKKAAAEESEKQLQKLRFNTQGQIRTEGVPLKKFPYGHSSTILMLEKGEDVTVLVTSKYWYRIRTPKGEEGWIYYEFLGPLS
jgi:SH3-like domain-containing protein